MGPTERDVALALAGMVPVNGKLFTRPSRITWTSSRKSADDRGTTLIAVTEDEVARDHAARPGGLPVRRACRKRGPGAARVRRPGNRTWRGAAGHVERQARPRRDDRSRDGLLRPATSTSSTASRRTIPRATERIWNMAIERYADVERRIAVFNCRADRPDRSQQLGRIVVDWAPADYYVLIGTGTYIFGKAATDAGLDPLKTGIRRESPYRGDFRNHRRTFGPFVAGDGHGEHRRRGPRRGPLLRQSQYPNRFQIIWSNYLASPLALAWR